MLRVTAVSIGRQSDIRAGGEIIQSASQDPLVNARCTFFHRVPSSGLVDPRDSEGVSKCRVRSVNGR